MKPKFTVLTLSVILARQICWSQDANSTTHAGVDPNVLWYDKPAAKWEEALPVGNGRVGAMIFGGSQPGTPATQRRHALGRRTLRSGESCGEGRAAGSSTVGHRRQIPRSRPAHQRQGHGQTARPDAVSDRRRSAVDISWYDNLENYRRELNLDTATATVSYTSDGVRHTREVFASAPDNVIVVRLTANKPGRSPSLPA